MHSLFCPVYSVSDVGKIYQFCDESKEGTYRILSVHATTSTVNGTTGQGRQPL